MIPQKLFFSGIYCDEHVSFQSTTKSKMYLLPLLISTLLLFCHAAILPNTYQLPFMENTKNWNHNIYDYYHILPKLHQSEQLLSQYRKYLINAIYENNDVCNLFEYLTDNNNDIWVSNDVIENSHQQQQKGISLFN